MPQVSTWLLNSAWQGKVWFYLSVASPVCWLLFAPNFLSLILEFISYDPACIFLSLFQQIGIETFLVHLNCYFSSQPLLVANERTVNYSQCFYYFATPFVPHHLHGRDPWATRDRETLWMKLHIRPDSIWVMGFVALFLRVKLSSDFSLQG